MKELNIIIYSFLKASGGGRETWLNVFLPELYTQTGGKCKITVYYLFKNCTEKLLDVVSDKRFDFVPVHLFRSDCFVSNVMGLLKFVWIIVTSLRKHASDNSWVLSIGSFYEVIPVYISRFLPLGKKKFNHGIWLRTIWAKQIKVLKSNRIAGTVIKFEHVNLKKSDLIIANGWDTAAYYTRSGVRCVVIPNALPLEKYANINLSEKRKDVLVISYIGRLSREKGLIDFLKAAVFFNKKYASYSSEIRFEVVGDGPLKKNVLNCKEPNLIYRGEIPNEKIIPYLGGINVGVALTYSNNELGGGAGVSNQLLELVAAKRIIVAWDTPVFTQVITEKEAFLVTEADYERLADTYQYILANYKTAYHKASRLEYVRERYSIQKHVKLFLETIEEMSKK